MLNEIASQDGAPFNVIKNVLSKLLPRTSAPVSDGIEAIYISCVPDDELDGDTDTYDLTMRFLCLDENTQSHVDRELLMRMTKYDAGAVVDRLKFSFFVELTSQTVVSDLSTFERFSEWDYLSGLDDIRQLQNI